MYLQSSGLCFLKLRSPVILRVRLPGFHNAITVRRNCVLAIRDGAGDWLAAEFALRRSIG